MIFPDWGTVPDTAPEEALPLFREWAVDWENGCFALRRGEPYLVSGDEALKIWVTRALRLACTERRAGTTAAGRCLRVARPRRDLRAGVATREGTGAISAGERLRAA